MVLDAALSVTDVTLQASLNAQVHTSSNITLGHALLWDSQGRLAVDVANDAEADNTRPITAAAVFTEIGNIDVLLQTI